MPRSLDLPERTTSTYTFVISPENGNENLLGPKRGPTEDLYLTAIDNYNQNYPMSKIDISSLDKSKLAYATYMSKLREACKDRIEIIDQSSSKARNIISFGNTTINFI